MPTNRLEGLQRFVEQDPADPFAHYALGLALASMDRFEEARQKFEEAIRLEPAYVPAYHQLGLLCARTGRLAEAAAALSKGIELARSAGDLHAQEEMQEALDELDNSHS